MIRHFLLKYPDIASLTQSVEKGPTKIFLDDLVLKTFQTIIKFKREVIVCCGKIPYGKIQKRHPMVIKFGWITILGMTLVKSTRYPYHRLSDSAMA